MACKVYKACKVQEVNKDYLVAMVQMAVLNTLT
ncbi:Uncharacterised protein [Mycobacterium tuberculosis]|nr:Uncharacterised protein [Mycobacterium tuberculosis]